MDQESNIKHQFSNRIQQIINKMIKSVIVFVAIFAITFSHPLSDEYVEIVQDVNGDQYYLLPISSDQQILSRQRRQLSGGISNTGADLSATGNLLTSGSHRLDGTATVAKTFGGPLSKGGSLDYTNTRNNAFAGVSAMHTPKYGTDVGAKAGYNFFQSRDGRTTGSVSANYDRHFGGAMGASRPNYGAFLNFNHRF